MSNFTAYFVFGVGLFLPAFLNWLMLRFWLPSWWQRRLVRIVMQLSVLAVITVLLRISAATFLGFESSPTILGLGLALTWLPQFALLITLPVVILWLKAGTHFLTGGKDETEPKVDTKRRAFLRTSAVALPVVAMGSSIAGILGTVGPARVFVLPVQFPNLPAPLRKLRILHLTDVHLGGVLGLDHLAQTLDRAVPHHPDLIAVTGDLADDLNLLPEALTMLENVGAPLGVFAILGNHEYGNGVKKFYDIIARSSVKLLVNSGHPIQVGDATLFIAGVDDILGRVRGQSPKSYMENAVAVALKDSKPDDFTILLSHRPNTFPIAASHSVPFTLAGHTHGGQAALAGHSWLEVLNIEDYVWGFYRINNSLIYTSSGAGQWAPIRIGCPAEAPIFELG